MKAHNQSGPAPTGTGPLAGLNRHHFCRAGLLSLTALTGLFFAFAGIADAKKPKKPKKGHERLLEFVDAQEETVFFDLAAFGLPSDFKFVPPVPNFFGWNEPGNPIAVSFDFAGLADKTCGGVAGTTFGGKVQEKTLKDGRVRVKLKLVTCNAIAWAIEGDPILDEETGEPTGTYNYDFGGGPVVFGTRWAEDPDTGECVIDGPLALGTIVLDLKFILAEEGAPMPHLFDLMFAPQEGQEFLKLSVKAVAEGLTPDGDPAKAGTRQLVKDDDGSGNINNDEFTVERVFLHIDDDDDDDD